jgi:Uma2 family endonuclease
MDVGTYARLVEAGALAGVEAELLNGLLVDKRSHRADAIHRIDVGTYERMVASGALEGQRVELLEGLLVAVSPQGPDHAEVIRRLTRYLAPASAWLGVQLPLEVRWGSLPEPDLALTELRVPRGRHPRSAMLAIEVAVTSHTEDRGAKADMYAGAPVPVYWLVDVPGRAVEVRTDPGAHGYGRCATYRVGEHVPSPAAGVPELDLAWLFDSLGS